MQQNEEKEMCVYHNEYKQELWLGEGLYCESCLLDSALEAQFDGCLWIDNQEGKYGE